MTLIRFGVDHCVMYIYIGTYLARCQTGQRENGGEKNKTRAVKSPGGNHDHRTLL